MVLEEILNWGDYILLQYTNPPTPQRHKLEIITPNFPIVFKISKISKILIFFPTIFKTTEGHQHKSTESET